MRAKMAPCVRAKMAPCVRAKMALCVRARVNGSVCVRGTVCVSSEERTSRIKYPACQKSAAASF